MRETEGKKTHFPKDELPNLDNYLRTPGRIEDALRIYSNGVAEETPSGLINKEFVESVSFGTPEFDALVLFNRREKLETTLKNPDINPTKRDTTIQQLALMEMEILRLSLQEGFEELPDFIDGYYGYKSRIKTTIQKWLFDKQTGEVKVEYSFLSDEASRLAERQFEEIEKLVRYKSLQSKA